MNLVLFYQSELTKTLVSKDDRAQHILKVLKLRIGESFRSGIVNGNLGQSTIQDINEKGIVLKHDHSTPAISVEKIDLICGLARPNSLKRILKDCATMNIRSINFIHTDLGEKSYRTSKLLEPLQYTRLLIEGASQGGVTHLPKIVFFKSIDECLSHYKDHLIVFDNTATASNAKGLYNCLQGSLEQHIGICIGSERGWSTRERNVFNEYNVPAFILGNRPLRSDTAFIAAIDRVTCITQLLK